MDETHAPTNREKAMHAKGGKFYCGCDATQIGKSDRCPVCYHRPNRKKRRGILSRDKHAFSQPE